MLYEVITLGREDKDGAEKIIGNAFTFQVILSLILTAVLLIWNRDFLLAFGASENTIGYATGYMNIYAVGTLFVQLTRITSYNVCYTKLLRSV